MDPPDHDDKFDDFTIEGTHIPTMPTSNSSRMEEEEEDDDEEEAPKAIDDNHASSSNDNNNHDQQQHNVVTHNNPYYHDNNNNDNNHGKIDNNYYNDDNDDSMDSGSTDDNEDYDNEHSLLLLLFRAMMAMPWPFLIVLPVVFVVLIYFGWTQDEIVEEHVANLWIPTSGDFYDDSQYIVDLDALYFSNTAFLAMALPNYDKVGDDTNLFTANRLEEIRQRMEQAETTTITYKGNTYTWDDVCMDNSISKETNYLFPCVRLSAMDLFQEAQWFFDDTDKVTWYNGVIRENLIEPFIPRLGILQQMCTTPANETRMMLMGDLPPKPCDHQVRLRSDPIYAMMNGYPRTYADPAGLIGDVGSLEFNDPCRICIEDEYDKTITQLHQDLILNFFMWFEIQMSTVIPQIPDGDDETRDRITDLREKAGILKTSITRKDVEDFFLYYVVRATYSEMGAQFYLETYTELMNSPLSALCSQPNVQCPPAEITLEEAKLALLRHADNTFSSISTAGAPLPMWGQDPVTGETGYLLDGSFPVSGSGINMNASLFSIVDYFDLLNLFNSPNPMFTASGAIERDELWVSMVERNPIFAWFMASLEPMTSHCGNENLPSSNTGTEFIDSMTAPYMEEFSRQWCTNYSIPVEQDETYTRQHFARMWYDLLLDSDSFLNLTKGTSDPYTWTLGIGCGYTVGGQRDPYTNQNDTTILKSASRELYYIDEGVLVGAIDRNLLLGDVYPPIGEYDMEKRPLEHVGVIQSIYPTLIGHSIAQRVQNCNRPQSRGGPIYGLTEEDGNAILYLWKEAFEHAWTGGDTSERINDGDEVQFVGYYDDFGAIGTTGRLLRDVTLSNGRLTAISVIIIALFSIIFLFSTDLVESRVLVTIIGVVLVISAYFAALGLSLLLGIKQNITTAWTLPFIILGLGVDDMYIVLIALQKQNDYSRQSFLGAMKEVVVPVTITSLVNASMFAIMNISNIPAIALTAQVALICVIFLYLVIIICFPAYCYLDMCRQASRRHDVFFCFTASTGDYDNSDSDQDSGGQTRKGNNAKSKKRKSASVGTFLAEVMYRKFFKPLLLGKNREKRLIMHALTFAITLGILGLAIYGITIRKVGLGLEDFFPADHQAGTWARMRTEELASWTISMNWGALDYGDPDIQMHVIKQFEDIVSLPTVAEIDTKYLWIANLAVWSTRQCGANVVRANPNVYECGRDQVYDENDDSDRCSGTWKLNRYELREKAFAAPSADTCQAFEGGICRPTSQMHVEDLVDLGVIPDNVTKPGPEYEDEVWCPVVEGWSDDKMQFCLQRWRNLTGGSGNLILDDENGTPLQDCGGVYYNDETVRVPIPYSVGPTMFGIHLNSHEETLDLIHDTRAICDDDPEVHCWMTGIPYNFWSQYITVFSVLLQVGGVAIAVAFVVSFVLLFTVLSSDGYHPTGKILGSSIIGALLITITNLLSIVTVSGLSILAGVNLTGFAIMSFVLSVAFSVEYAVHVVSRWLRADMNIVSSLDRVDYTMSFLMLPTFMSFVSSLVGVCCLAFTEFAFCDLFFFRPLIIVMFVTYFYGCYWLPVALVYLDYDVVKAGKVHRTRSHSMDGKDTRNY